MWWILLAITALILIYWKVVLPHRYWSNRNIKQKERPTFLLGDNAGVMFTRQSFAEMIQDCYNQFPNERYSGIYQFLLPTLVLRDPDLIKQITVKDFDHFLNHRTLIPDGVDELWSRNLFSLRGEKWRHMRATLSPSFTSSKMRAMYNLINDCAHLFVQHFADKTEKVLTLDMKEIYTRYANDVIATCAFGVRCDSLNEQENEFYMMGKEATNFSGIWTSIVFFGYIMCPSVFTLFKVKLFSKRVGQFFKTLVKGTITFREENHIIRPDMINLLMEARKGRLKYSEEAARVKEAGFATVEESDVGRSLPKTAANAKHELSDLDITAQALVFFFAGFDTISTLMSFMSYELAVNPDIQDKLIVEVEEAVDANQGKITYELVHSLKYLDMVVTETLRKWPPTISVERECTKPYTIEPTRPGETPVHLQIGDILWLPLYGLHRDPKIYPDPERFDPERFNEENRDRVHQYTYLPFGAGPRNCIGSRFALMEAKTVFVHMLLKFKFVPVEKTDIPFKICKKKFNLNAANGFWLGLEKRS